MEALTLQEREKEPRRLRLKTLFVPAIVVILLLVLSIPASIIWGFRNVEEYVLGVFVLVFWLNPSWHTLLQRESGTNSSRRKLALIGVACVAIDLLILRIFGNGGAPLVLVGFATAIGLAVLMVMSYRRDRAFRAQPPTTSVSR